MILSKYYKMEKQGLERWLGAKITDLVLRTHMGAHNHL